MLKYSFMSKHSNCSKDEIVNFLENTDKEIKYTYGFKYRHPTTYEVPITADEAISAMDRHWTDVTEYDTWVDVNSYSDNDMWGNIIGL